MIIVSRIINVKLDRRLNVTNKFKYQRRLSSRLAIVMFRGTPCRLDWIWFGLVRFGFGCIEYEYMYMVWYGRIPGVTA